MKLLVIEDNRRLIKVLKEGLKRAGFIADFVLDGETGQRRIELYHEDYDLVILDLMLPQKDGMTVLKNIREQNINIPILILTAKNNVNDVISGLDEGADDYIIKPFLPAELFSRMKAILRRPKKSFPKELIAGGLTLNPVTRKVFLRGREISLTLKEFNLLEYLMRHPNQVLSREEILFNVWSFDFDSFSNVIDVHIKNLRKKMNCRRQDKLLETVRGIGYRINGLYS